MTNRSKVCVAEDSQISLEIHELHSVVIRMTHKDGPESSLRCMAKIITSTVGPPCHCAIPLINASNSSSQDCIY